jgi:Glycosyltransferase like family
MKVYIGFCSTATSLEDLKSRGKCNIANSENQNDVTSIDGIFSNTTAIAKNYNTFIESHKDEDCILVLAHDDVLITDKEWVSKLHQALEKYDIVGLAGGSDAALRPPTLWHIMCPKETHRGDVYHKDLNNNSVYKTHFGKNGRVLILDGLFLAFNPKKIFEAGVKFDETCPAKFHFYDIDFSLQCNKAKLKLGTTNINVVHASPGLRSFTKEWNLGQDWFLQKAQSGNY